MPSPLTTIPSTGLEANLVTQIQQGGGPKISSITYSGNDTAALPAGGQTITISGSGFTNSSVIYIDGTVVGVVSYVNANTLTFVAPAKAASNYSLYVVNADGATAISVPGISYSNAPVWSTSSGSIGSPYEANTFNVSLSATGDGAVTYAMAAGNSLPSGLTLASNGYISGTVPATDPTTTYTFYVDAVDAQNQETTRSFSITYNKDAVTWSSPANGAAYSLNVGDSVNTALSATSAANQSISFSVASGSLPANVSISGSNIVGVANADQVNTAVVIRATAANTNRYADRTFYYLVLASSSFINRIVRTGNAEAAFYPLSVDIDSQDNIYFCGRTYSGSATQPFIAKFNSTGSSLEWVKSYSYGSYDTFNAIKASSNGELYIAGTLNNSAYGGIFKLNSAGEFIWQKGYGTGVSGSGNYYTELYGVTVDSSNNVIATGLNRSAYSPLGGGIIRKFNSSGTVQWSKDIEETDNNNQQFHDIITDSSDNIYAIGVTQYQQYGDETHAYVVKLNSSGTIQWQKGIGEIQQKEAGYSIDLDSSGNVYIVIGNRNGYPTIMKMSSSTGSITWAKKVESILNSSYITPIRPSDVGTSVKVRGSYVYLFAGVESGGTGGKLLIAKFDLNGSLQWQRSLDDTTSSPAAFGFDSTVGTVSQDGNYVIVASINTGTPTRGLVAKFPSDGTGTGTYSSYVYANSSYTISDETNAVVLTGYPTVSLSAQNSNGTEITPTITPSSIAASVSTTKVL